MKTSASTSAADTGHPIRVLEFAFTGYPVIDMIRARAFYEDVLGLTKGMVWEDSDGAWIEYNVGGHTLAITNASPQWRPSGSGPAIALEVEDFEMTVATLRARGVRFRVEPMEVPTCRMAVILDPEGNALAIHKRTPPGSTSA